jgi:lysozyme family protein
VSEFLPAYEATILREGGYVLHDVSGDRGGQTYAGISRKKWPNWRGWRTIDDGEVPEASDVRGFYQANFWSTLRLVEIVNQHVAECIYDFAVNAGTNVAVKLAQIVVGSTPDGLIGPKTLLAINTMDPEKFTMAFTLAKIARYRDIVRKDKTQLKFLVGWINRALEAV